MRPAGFQEQLVFGVVLFMLWMDVDQQGRQSLYTTTTTIRTDYVKAVNRARVAEVWKEAVGPRRAFVSFCFVCFCRTTSRRTAFPGLVAWA